MTVILIILIVVAILYFNGYRLVKKDDDDKCQHDWEYIGDWGITYQQKRCKICKKLKIVDQ